MLEKLQRDQEITGYSSLGDLKNQLLNIIGSPPAVITEKVLLKASCFDSPLGPMVALADEQKLYLLEFVERRGLEREIERLRKKTKAAIIPGSTDVITMIKKELEGYFKGELYSFETPLHLLGSPFQQRVWKELQAIPAGQTCSYKELAEAIGKPTASRAVAQANGANQLALIIPCHRVINSDGKLGGYGGGIEKKEWLLAHEKQYYER